MSKLDAALDLAELGFKVFPIAPNAKAPPLLAGWPKRATNDADQIELFWSGAPDANIGIHCEGLLVVDVDVKKGGAESLQLLDLTYGFDETLISRTPSGGLHYVYMLPEGHPGVTNSVEVLGKGLDIRSTNGYIVAPGSTLAAGAYEFTNPDTPIAPAPDWLIEKLAVAAPRKEPVAKVPDAQDAEVERAISWLKLQDPAVEGDAGDLQTYKVACGLRDMGVSSQQAFDLLQDDWNGRCAPPWSSDGLWAKVTAAYSYAKGEPGSKAVTADSFDDVHDSEAFTKREQPRKPTSLMKFSDIISRGVRDDNYLIKGIVSKRSYAQLLGPPGAGKTFVALDMAYSIAAGEDWMGHKVKQGTVLYLAYEGIGGLDKRCIALTKKYASTDVPMYVCGEAFNMREQSGRKALGELIAQLPEKPTLIIFDTFAQALMGADENSAQDTGAFHSAVGSLMENTGATVMMLHHTGKNKAAGGRGSSSTHGALDTALEVDDHKISHHKQREIEMGDPQGFRLDTVILGIDSDGDEITSCVVQPTAVHSASSDRLTGNFERGFAVLCEMSPDNKPVPKHKWRAECGDFLNSKRGAAFHDMIKGLVEKGRIVSKDGMITRRLD